MSIMPYKVRVGVCRTNCICYDPIEYYTEVYAVMHPDGDRDILLLPWGRLSPGVWRGGVAVVAKRDMRQSGGSDG